MKLDVNLGEKPLWSQLYDILSDRIDSGYYKVGDTMPAEVQLMDEFGVSRITVRQAMDKLLSENKISRRRGKGTIVLEKQNKISTMFQSSFASLKENEDEFKRKLIWVKYVEAPDDIAEIFKIGKGSKILCLKRYWEDDDDKVLSTHFTYIHPITKMTDQTDFTQSLYARYKEFGFEIESVSEEITASIATKEEREEFCVGKKTTALMNRARKGYHGGYIVEYTVSKYLSDGYTLYINNM